MSLLVELEGARWDAIVIGAGIAGCAAAYDLASRGYRTCLIDKADIGAGTSQATTNLIHGGLRYLKRPLAGIPLVRTALRERAWLMEAAPHLVRPAEFLIPVYDRSPDGMLALRIGLGVYDWFSGGKPAKHRMLSKDGVRTLEPALNGDTLKGGALYTDCQARPERLCLAYAKSAEEQGAVIRTYAECTDLRTWNSGVALRVQDRLTDEVATLEGRVLVNASGPWLDELARAMGDRTQRLTLTKGVHIIYDDLLSQHAVYASSPVDGRYVFAIPWRGFSLIGTTDTRHAESPDAVGVAPEDVRYLLDSARALFPAANVRPGRIVTFTAGLRPLRHDPRAKESDISRDYSITESERVLSMVGVKLTTARAAAEELGGRVNRILRHDGKSRTRGRPLYGGDVPPGFLEPWQFIESELKQNHGSKYIDVLKLSQDDPELADRICECWPTILAEAAYAARHEHVRKAEDFLRRRTRSDLCTCGGDIAGRVVPVLGKELGWDEARRWSEIEAWNRRQEWLQGWRNV